MAFKPTHYGKVFRHKGYWRRWAYSGNYGQWRKLQQSRAPTSRYKGTMSNFDFKMISKAWEPAPGRSAVPWRRWQ